MKTNTKIGIAGAGAAGALALAVSFIAPWEGKENKPYLDIVGVKTWCYGETQGVPKPYYSDQECKDLLVKAVDKRYMEPIINCVPQIKDNEYVLAASTSLAYNIGTKAFCGSTVAKKFRALDFKGGCAGFPAWSYAGGKQVRGLLNRRKAEQALCEKGLT